MGLAIIWRGVELVLDLLDGPRNDERDLMRFGCPQQPCDKEEDAALQQPEPQERGGITLAGDDHLDWNNCQGRAGSEPGGGEAHGEPTAIGKPFDRSADAGGVDPSGAEPG